MGQLLRARGTGNLLLIQRHLRSTKMKKAIAVQV
jgi:hypothetical protein